MNCFSRLKIFARSYSNSQHLVSNCSTWLKCHNTVKCHSQIFYFLTTCIVLFCAKVIEWYLSIFENSLLSLQSLLNRLFWNCNFIYKKWRSDWNNYKEFTRHDLRVEIIKKIEHLNKSQPESTVRMQDHSRRCNSMLMIDYVWFSL